MGGRAAEELVFREPTTGAVSDIEQATKIARAMVTEYGMSAQARRRPLRHRARRPVPRPHDGQPGRLLATRSRTIIDDEVRKLIEAAHTEAWEILTEYRDVLDTWPASCWRRRRCTAQDLERIFDRRQEAAADHRVQRLRRPHPVGQAADQDARRAGHRARRAVAAGHRAASPRPSAPTRAATAPPPADLPRRLPAPARSSRGARPYPQRRSPSTAQRRAAQLRRAPRVAPGHHARRADVAAARARSSRGACPRRRRAPTAARRGRPTTPRTARADHDAAAASTRPAPRRRSASC